MIDALSCLPLEDVNESKQYLTTVTIHLKPRSCVRISIANYVSGSFRVIQQSVATLMIPLTMRQVPPMFLPPLWNVHDATLNNNACINNICEGWNNKFFKIVGHYHPSIWLSLNGFNEKQQQLALLSNRNLLAIPRKKSVSKIRAPPRTNSQLVCCSS